MTPDPQSSPRRWPTICCLAALFGLTAIVFAPIVTFQYAFDDHKVITDQLDVPNLAALAHKIAPAGAAEVGESTWRPLVSLSYLATWNLGGRSAAAHHLVDLALHALAVTLLGALLLRLGAKPLAAVAGALVFGLHPLTAGVVSMISFREEPLTAVLGLTALLLITTPRRGPRLLSLAFFAAAPFAKETGLAFGLVPALLPHGRDREGRWLSGAAAGAVAIAMLIVVWANHAFTRGFAQAERIDRSWGQRLAVAGQAMFDYARRLVLWRELSPLHDDVPTAPWPTLQALVGLALLAFLVFVVVRGLFRPSTSKTAAGLALFSLLPTLNLLLPFWVKQADRFCYLPLVAVGLAVGVAMDRAERAGNAGGRRRLALVAVTAAVLSLLAIGTGNELPRYRNSFTLFSSVVERQPGSLLGKLYLAQEYVDRGDCGEALRLLTPVLQAHPNDLKAANAAAECYVRGGEPGRAVALLAARDLNGPDGASAAVTLQAAFFAGGRYSEGLALAMEWVSRADVSEATRLAMLRNAALAAANAGQMEAATQLAREVLRRQPDLPPDDALRVLALRPR